MKKIYLLTLLLALNLAGYSQKFIEARVVDYVTNVALDDSLTTVELLTPDSVVITPGILNTNASRHRKVTTAIVQVEEEGRYIVRCSHPDYHTLYVPVRVKFYRRENRIDVGKFALKRKPRFTERTLGEATVTATRLKFYFNKDTLVYNADAFITQEGFALQDILHKMPGMTINNDGEILSNGRKVETMLLNGKDFFNNDRQTLLENLPAFMVKSVKVYNKEKDTLSAFEREREMEGLVMDVRLKPQYNTTTLGSVDAAGGTGEHYYGRLFAMKIDDFRRWSVYAGANDINRNEDVARNGQFYNMDNGMGEKDFYNAGINYNIDDNRGRYSLEGKTRVQASREWMDTRQVAQMFYAGGDSYALGRTTNKARNFSVQTDHSFLFLNETPWAFSLKPSFSHIRSKSESRQLGGTFDRNATELLGAAWVDSLQESNLGEALRLYGINRSDIQTETPTTFTRAKLEAEKAVYIPHTADKLTIDASGVYTHNGMEMFTRRDISYIRQGLRPWQNQYQHAWGDSWEWKAGAEYVYQISDWHSLSGKLSYGGSTSSSNDLFYNLHELDGWGFGTGMELGSLPSQEEMQRVLDHSNSKAYKETGNTMGMEVAYKLDKGKYHLVAAVPFNRQRRELDFFQYGNDKAALRTLFRPDVNVSFSTWMQGHTGYNYSISYSLEHKLPHLLYLIDQTNDANPLMVVKGNPSLDNPVLHKLNGNFYWAPSMKNNHLVGLSYQYFGNQTAMSAVYDRLTGVYTYTPKSVDGNQLWDISFQNAVFLSPKFTHKLTNKLKLSFGKSVDYSGENVQEASVMSVVHNYKVAEELSYGFSTSNTKLRGEVAPYVNYSRATSSRPNFLPIDAFDFGVRVSAQYELPWSLRLQTSLRSVSRRGYNDPSMNDDEFIWNASLTKTFKKGVSLTLEGFDILGQRDNALHYVNAQGRTETVFNLLRRYAMLHVALQFNRRSRP